MNLRSILTGCTVIAAAASLHAATLLGFRYPVGVPVDAGSGMTQSMGGASVGLVSDNNLMLGNPANLGMMSKTVFSAFVTTDIVTMRYTAAEGASNRMVTFMPKQLSFGFPLGVAGGIGVAYERKYDLASRFSYSVTPDGPLIQTIDKVNFDYARNGGLVAWRLGWGYSIGKWAQVGLSYERFYLAMRAVNRVETVGYQTDWSLDSTSTSMGANGLSGGIMIPVLNGNIGISGSYPFQGEAVRQQTLEGANITLSSSSSTFRLKYPPSIAIGASYSITPEWLAAADLKVVLWDKYSSEGVLPSGTVADRALTFSLGGQYIPSPNLLMPKYWETVQYRAGFRYAQAPITDAGEWAFTLGAGLPLSGGGGLLDVVLEYGQRFDESYPDYDESFFRIGLGINGGRKWVKSTQSTY